VALVGYTFYKGEANVGVLEHQVDDLLAALEFLARPDSPACLSTRPVVLSGHSSGAHLCAMLLLREASRPRAGPPLPRVVGFVAFSGVFDIAEHYLYEARRSVRTLTVVPCVLLAVALRFAHLAD
jgi:acetyl esterase/lipase